MLEEAKDIDNPQKTLGTIDGDFFPNIKRLITIACTFTVTNTKCERSISHLRYLKNFMRCTMLQEHLNRLALLYVHQDIDCPQKWLWIHLLKETLLS